MTRKKSYKAYVTLVLIDGFNIMVYKKCFCIFYSNLWNIKHETSKCLPLILLWGLCLQNSIKKLLCQSFLPPKPWHSVSKCCLSCVIKYYFTINFTKVFTQYFPPVLLGILPTIDHSINPNIKNDIRKKCKL